jgi:proteic killer suppression protein
MEIGSIRHKALRKFMQAGQTKGVIEPKRVNDMLTFIEMASAFDALAKPPNFDFHPRAGDRKSSFAMTITRNWRLTFTRIDDQTIADLDIEDYH